MVRRTTSHVFGSLLCATALGCSGGGPAAPIAPAASGASPSASGATPAASASGAPIAASTSPRSSPDAPGTSSSAGAPVRPSVSIKGERFGAPVTERPHVQPTPFRIADLPVASLPEPHAANAKLPTNLVVGDPALDVTVTPDAFEAGARNDDYRALANVKDAAYAQIRIGSWNGWSGGVFGSSGGASVRCGTRGIYSATLPAHWLTLKPNGGTVELGVATGWFDRAACKASAMQRASVVAKAVPARGLVVAFRNCGKTCADKQHLVLLLPRAQMLVATGIGGDATRESGAFSRVTLPLRRGGGGSMMARVGINDVVAWRRAFAPAAAGAGAANLADGQVGLSGTVLVGVEVSQGVDDPEPVAVVYVDEGA